MIILLLERALASRLVVGGRVCNNTNDQLLSFTRRLQYLKHSAAQAQVTTYQHHRRGSWYTRPNDSPRKERGSTTITANLVAPGSVETRTSTGTRTPLRVALSTARRQHNPEGQALVLGHQSRAALLHLHLEILN